MKEKISLEEIFRSLKKKIVMIVIFGLMGVLVSGLFTFFIQTPVYESSSRIVVNQTQNTNQSITNTDIQTNLSLINTYQSIIKEPIILEDVLEKTSTDLTLAELSDKITVQINNNSLVFGISVHDENPSVAAELANAVASTFEEKIGEILDVQSVTILSQAVANPHAVSPNVTMNLLIGLVLGLLLGSGTAILADITDKRVKDFKTLEELGWTHLGSVLEMTYDEITETRISKNISTKPAPVFPARQRV